MMKLQTERLILRNYTMDAYKEDADGNPVMIRSRVYRLDI